nr:reverse transcriptase domain-containing protein [Tanacetum cinerariifolium]
MPLKMRTRSAGRLVVESLGETGVRVGRGGRGRRPREGNDERVNDLNGQGNDQGTEANGGEEGVNVNVSNRENVGNQNGNVVNENVYENIVNVIVNGNRVGCSYKEFLACNPKEYDVKGGAVVLTRWIKKMESMHDMSGCGIDQKIKYTAGSFVGKALTMVAATEPKTIQKAVQISDALTDEAVRNGLVKKVEKRGNMGEPNKDKNGKDDNKRTRTKNVFATTINPVGRENTSTWPKGVPRNVNRVNVRNPTVRACYECGSTDHVRSACPRLNRAQGPKENRPNQVVANKGGQCRGNQGNQARGRAFMLGVEEDRQDSNIVTGIEPNDLDFRYKIKIARGKLVEIDKVVRIPLSDGKVLRVLGERPEEKARFLMVLRSCPNEAKTRTIKLKLGISSEEEKGKEDEKTEEYQNGMTLFQQMKGYYF